MDIEIRTTTDTWIAQLDDAEFGAGEAGAAAEHLRNEIQAGRAIEVRPASDGSGRPSFASTHVVVFNPGHVICVTEKARRSRASGFRGLGGL